MRTSALSDAKYIEFFLIYGVSARTGGVEPVRTFYGQGEKRQFFAILCGRPLWMTPYKLFQMHFFNFQMSNACNALKYFNKFQELHKFR